MNVEEVIEKLEKLKNKYGNVNVLVFNDTDYWVEIDESNIYGDDENVDGEKNVYISS